MFELHEGTGLGTVLEGVVVSLESLGQLVGQRDMRERRLLTHELSAVCVPAVGIKNRRKV